MYVNIIDFYWEQYPEITKLGPSSDEKFQYYPGEGVNRTLNATIVCMFSIKKNTSVYFFWKLEAFL